MKIAIVLAAVLACAYAAPNKYIIDGSAATIEDFPYLVSVQWGKYDTYYHICGGAILNELTVITAKHCCGNYPERELFVLANTDDVKVTKSNIGDLDIHKVQKIFKTPIIESTEKPTEGEDLCILHLATPFEETQARVVIPEVKVEPTKLALAGWGYEKSSSTQMSEKLLQSTDISIIDDDECRSTLKGLGVREDFLHPDNFCTSHAGTDDKFQTVCNGDSGGPLVDILENNVYSLRGIVTWGVIPCGADKIPSIFTDVVVYKAVIEENIKEFVKPSPPEEGGEN